MSERIRTFFRHCPNCGRRFEIRIVGKKLVDDSLVTSTEPIADAMAADSIVGGSAATPGYLLLDSGVPITVDVEEFQYSYKCHHCGHQWTEVREETHGERGAPTS